MTMRCAVNQRRAPATTWAPVRTVESPSVPSHSAIVGMPEIGGDPVGAGVVSAVRRSEERRVPDAEHRPQEVAVPADLLGHRAVGERRDVGVGPGVVAEGHLSRVHERPEDGGVVPPRAVPAVREEGQPDPGVHRQGERTPRPPRCWCRRRSSAPGTGRPRQPADHAGRAGPRPPGRARRAGPGRPCDERGAGRRPRRSRERAPRPPGRRRRAPRPPPARPAARASRNRRRSMQRTVITRRAGSRMRVGDVARSRSDRDGTTAHRDRFDHAAR